MSSPEFDYEAARAFQRAKQMRRREILDARFREASRAFRKITAMIWTTFQPKAIYQWGSLLDRKRFSEISDIDIALEGRLTAEDFFALYAEAETMTDLPLDIIELDKIHPNYAERIRTHGRLIYG